jgi:hypothetical protein
MARRIAFENGEITGARNVAGGTWEQRSHLDARLSSATTPQSAIDNWGAQSQPVVTQDQRGGSSDADRSEGTTSGKSEE